MPDDVDRLVGRRHAIALVRELMARPEQRGMPRSQDHPVLVLEGGRGSGKSALLAELVTLLDQRVPYAHIDFEKNQHATVPEVLSALAFELSRRCRRYGVLRFPRLTVGQVAMRQKGLDLDDHSRASQQIRAALEKERNVHTLRQILEDAAGDVLKVLPVPVPPVVASGVLRLILNRLTEWAPGRRVALGSFHEWYGHRGRDRENDALDVLVDLNRWARSSDDEDNRQRIDQLLWDAFLADLREQFASSKAGELSLNCVVLLDNADTRLGQMFVNGLIQARRQRAATDRGTADPLTAVVTSRGELLADVPAESVELTPTNGEVRFGTRHEGGTRRWWCRYRLLDLTQDEVGSMVSTLALRKGNNQRLTLMAHQLTGGHPASARLLLKAVAEHPENRDELSTILDQRAPDGQSQSDHATVAEWMQEGLLGEFPEEAFDDLVTCAAARERHHAVQLAMSSALLACSQVTYVEIIDPVLWPAAAGAGATLRRRLLLRRLAEQEGSGSPGWSQVFDWLRVHCAAAGDEAGELYYALANGDLAFVTRRLHGRLVSDEDTSWLDLLASVTTAPRRPQMGDAPVSPTVQLRTLMRTTDLPPPLVTLARLVASRWIAEDPFSGSRLRGLHLQIAADYNTLAGQSPNGAEHLLFAARDHQRQAESWN